MFDAGNARRSYQQGRSCSLRNCVEIFASFASLVIRSLLKRDPNIIDFIQSMNLDSLESKGHESVQSFAAEAVGLSTFLSPPRKHHSVTFASPIETLMHPDARGGVTPNSDRGLQMSIEPFRQRTRRQEGRERKDDRIVGGERFKNSYTSEDDALSPMLVPKTVVSSTDSISDMFSANETMTDGVDIKDIVEVLDDIHAVRRFKSGVLPQVTSALGDY
ncbi:hypothetical protein EDD15DRAFT_699961 [Pisolithus albus]|nr:hypothetical protein EDD15DRAFT_699961 [Pisolithus albus]